MRKFVKAGVFAAAVIAVTSLLSVLSFGQSRLPESSIKTIYIVPSSHYDFGFVEPPDKVRERAARHIDEVIRVAEENPSFRWTIESVWQINEWLKRQKKPTSVLPKDKEKISRLINLIKSGRIVVSAAWGSMHSDFMGGEEYNRLAYGYATLKRTYGISTDLLMMNDVPGHTASTPSVVAGSGIKYMVTGANTFIGVATSLAPGKVPFYWESPDGEKILIWVSQGTRGGYVEALTDFYLDPYSLDPYTDKLPFDMFNKDLIGTKSKLEIMEIGVTNLLNRYNAGGYKYDSVMTMYQHDFIEPTDVLNLERAVALWNSQHSEVKLRIATAPEFLAYVEGKYGPEIPTYRGDWSGLWSEAKTMSPKISALARYAQDHIPAAESLWSAISMTRQIPYPVGNISRLFDLLYTYDEHSGAGNNGWPQLNSSEPLEEQNREYVRDMARARREVDTLFTNGIDVIAQPTRFDAPKMPKASNVWFNTVYNGLSWERDDVVRVDAPAEKVHVTAVKDLSTGRLIPFDVEDGGRIIFVAERVPSMGYKTFELTTMPGEGATTLVRQAGTSTGNAEFNIKTDAGGNITSIYDVRRGREIVNTKGEMPFNALLRVEGQDASRVTYPLDAEVSVRVGRVMKQIVIKRDRSMYPLTTVTVYSGIDRAEIRNELDDSQLPFVGGNKNWNDSFYFAFPFNLRSEGLKVKRGGQKWFDTFPDDYLPGARRDGVTSQHMIAMTDGKSSALLAHRQSFHWVYPGYVPTKMRAKGAPKELPAMITGKFPLPEATMYSRAVRTANQADTHDLGVINVPTVEPGLQGRYIFEYSISSDAAFDPVRAWMMGAAFNLPLRGKYVAAAPVKGSESYFAVDQPNVEITTVKLLSDEVVRGEVSANPLEPETKKIYVLRLQEFGGRLSTVKISLPVRIVSADLVNLTEDAVVGKVSSLAPLTVTLKPFQTLTVRFEIE